MKSSLPNVLPTVTSSWDRSWEVFCIRQLVALDCCHYQGTVHVRSHCQLTFLERERERDLNDTVTLIIAIWQRVSDLWRGNFFQSLFLYYHFSFLLFYLFILRSISHILSSYSISILSLFSHPFCYSPSAQSASWASKCPFQATVTN